MKLDKLRKLMISGMLVMNLVNYLKEEKQIKTMIGDASTPKNNIYIFKSPIKTEVVEDGL